MAGPVPLKMGDIAQGNTFQGSCAKIIAEDDRRAVFSTRNQEFTTKERTVSVFSNVRRCIWGESRESRKNRRAQRKLAASLKSSESRVRVLIQMKSLELANLEAVHKTAITVELFPALRP